MDLKLKPFDFAQAAARFMRARTRGSKGRKASSSGS